MTNSHSALRIIRQDDYPSPSFQQTVPRRLAIVTSNSTYLLEQATISYCRAEGNYCMVVLQSGESILVSKPLKSIEAVLTTKRFIRTHQSYLVNTDHLREFRSTSVVMSDGTKLTVSRAKRKYVEQAIRAKCHVI